MINGKCILVCVLLGSVGSNSAEAINNLTHPMEVRYLVDAQGDLDVELVKSKLALGEFKTMPSQVVNFPIQDSVVWMAFKVNLTEGKQWFLSPGNESTVWQASLFEINSHMATSRVFYYDHLNPEGSSISFPFRTLAIELPSPTGSYLLRLSARRHRNYLLKVGDLSTMTDYLVRKEMIPVAFIAFMLCMFIYNCFLFISTRDTVFIPYLFYLLFVAYAIPFHSGYVLFSTFWMWQGNPFYTLWTSIGFLSGGLFAISYLNLRQNAPWVRVWIIFWIVVLVVVIPLLDTSGWLSIEVMALIVSIVSVTFNLSLLTASIYVWIKGVWNARFYTTGWLFVICSMVLFVLSTNGVIPNTSFVENSFYYGFALEAVLFAFALGDRMNVLKKEKRAIELNYLDYVTDQNKFLAQQSFMNAHLLRAPLSRILGLLNIIKFSSPSESAELIKHIESSTEEMDGIARRMSSLLEKRGVMDKYQADFDQLKEDLKKK